MSHWFDDAARGLSEGRVTRRAVLRRGGAVAGGALLASVTGPLRSMPHASAATPSGVPCPDFNAPCSAPDVCCGGEHCCNSTTEFCCGGSCIPRRPGVGCCHNSTYDPSIEKCCPQGGGPFGHACFKDEECCGTSECCKKGEFCCGGSCIPRRPGVGCCHNSTYDPSIEKCCPQGGGPFGHACFKDEECCGTSECCKKGEQCCNSGKVRYCAPKGHCCPKGQHRVTCGTGKGLCCPEGEYCCGGQCCKTGACHNGKCGGKCPPGQQMCFGKCGCPSDAKCCDKGDCAGATGQFVCCGVTTGAFVRAGNACCVGGKPGQLCAGVCCLQNCCGQPGFEVCCAPGQGCCDANGACVACSDIRLKRNVHTLSGSRRRP